MIRKTILTVAAVAALGTTALATSDASAKTRVRLGFDDGGIRLNFGPRHDDYGWRHRNWGPRTNLGFYGPRYRSNDCYEVVTRRGRIKTVCDY